MRNISQLSTLISHLWKQRIHCLQKYTFILDLTKSEEDLLKNMHSKARYNIKVARKYNVIVEEDNSDEAFEEYLRLTKEQQPDKILCAYRSLS